MFRSGTQGVDEIFHDVGKPFTTSAVDAIVKAASGAPLPGPFGLAQAVLTTLTKKREGNKYLRVGSAGLDVAGILLAHYREKHPLVSKPEPTILSKFIADKNLVIQSDVKEKLGAFVYCVIRSLPATELELGSGDGAAFVCLFNLNGEQTYYFMPQDWKNSGSKHLDDWKIPAGPYIVKGRDAQWLAAFRQQVWKNVSGYQLNREAKIFNEPVFSLSEIDSKDDFVSDPKTSSDVAHMTERLVKFRRAGIRRRLLLHGPPGTGKSTLAQHISTGVGHGRLLTLSSTAIGNLGMSMPLVRFLDPDVIVMDDIDRVTYDVQVMLRELQHFPKSMVVIATCNSTKQIDPAMMRTGRFDELIEIVEPDKEQLARILRHYCDKYQVQMPDETFEFVVDKTTGFSPADIREICSTLSVISPGSVDMDILQAEIDRVSRQRGMYDQYERNAGVITSDEDEDEGV